MSEHEWEIHDPERTYWYNTRTKEVEIGPQSLGMDRLGPFKTWGEAERGPSLLAERARQWNEEEEKEY